EWVHVQLHQQKGMISLSPPTICNSAVWSDAQETFDRTVDTHIKTLRAKLRAINPDLSPINTHRGMGYSLRSV
ncbi:winged helix-turn-helix domain-containing protein, partial [Salmonella sp. NW302]|uniref:winged helix-turn-helix domain-containing protein n=1 Tax=Salmonella sp. NW302 TaxID=2947881 RepID=UPI003F43A387